MCLHYDLEGKIESILRDKKENNAKEGILKS